MASYMKTDPPWLSGSTICRCGKNILLGLTGPGLFSILILITIQYQFFISQARTHLVKQAKLELAVMEDEYNQKVDQMKVSAQGQVKNPILIAAAQAYADAALTTAQGEDAIQDMLRQTAAELNIEYATLVSPDFHIIANANTDSSGDRFSPNSLVSAVLTTDRQMQTTTVVPWQELSQESSPLPVQFNPNDALIRYTATPVSDPHTHATLGVLVLGDVVTHKFPSLKSTVNKWGGGYSGVYRLASDGQLSLVASLAKNPDSDAPEVNQAARDLSVLKAAATAKGGLVTKRLQPAGGSMHVAAAKAVLDLQKQPVAILVRETSAFQAQGWLQPEFRLQLLLCGAIALLNLLLASLLARFITRPLHGLHKAAHLFDAGNRWIRSKAYASDEVGRLAVEFNKLADTVVRAETRLMAHTQQQQADSQKTRRLLEQIACAQVNSDLELAEVINRALASGRKILGVDRLLIYQFTPDGGGIVSAEAAASNWPSALNLSIPNTGIPQPLLDAFTQGQIAATANGLTADWHPDHRRLIKDLQVKASLAAPILHEGRLFGLLIADHCGNSHPWRLAEGDLMRQLAVQFGMALDRLSLAQKQQADAVRSRTLWQVTLQALSADSAPEIIARLPLSQLRQAIQTDRVLLYQFDPNGIPAIAAKSVAKGWLRDLNAQPYEPFLAAGDEARFKAGQVKVISNPLEANLTADGRRHLDRFAIQALLAIPIRHNNQLFGLLILHQCSAPRLWEDSTIDFCQQAAAQIEFALGRCALIRQRQLAADSAQSLAFQQQQQVDTWRSQLIDLLTQFSLSTNATHDVKNIVETLQALSSQATQTSQQTSDQRSDGETLLDRDACLAVSHQVALLTQAVAQVALTQNSTTRSAQQLLRQVEPLSQALDKPMPEVQEPGALSLRDLRQNKGPVKGRGLVDGPPILFG